jgi:hypothetical protein
VPEKLEPVLLETVREWVKANWPFAKVAYPGVDIPTDAWNALQDSTR